MKISKLLVLSALCLTTASVKAEVPEGVWTMPEPQGLEFTTFTSDGTYYYLYNPGAKMFFASGNSWNTQASVRTFGYPFWVTESSEEGAPEGSYELWDDFSNADRTDVTGPHNLFTDDGGSTWVDHGSQANYSWMFEIVGDFVRFQNVALAAAKPEYAGTYIGWAGDYAGDKNSSVLKMIAPDTPGTCIDWRAVTTASYEEFVASEAYTVYTNGVECFFLAKQLRDLLVEAEGISADVAAQLAIYNNTASTKEELAQAIADAKAAIEKRKQELVDDNYDKATVENPVVVTDKFLVNPDFKGDDLKTGWSGTEFGSYGPKENAEHYNKTYDTYQDVNGGMKPGVYAVGVKAFYRAGNAQPAYDNFKADNAASKYAKLYAKIGSMTREQAIVSPCAPLLTEMQGKGSESSATDAETGETYWFPNNMEAAEYYMHTLGHYDNKVLIAVNAETDTLRLGVKKSSGVDGDWSIFDDFSLTYYGKGADACELYLNLALQAYEPYEVQEDVIFTESYLTAYNEKVNQTYTASSLEDVNNILAGIDGAYNDLLKNIQLWKDLAKAVEDAKKLPFIDRIDEIDLDAAYDLSDYLFASTGSSYGDQIEEHNMTNEELEAQLAQIAEWIEAVREAAQDLYQPGDDVTALLTNPGFDDDADINFGGAEGWTVEKIAGDGNLVRGPLGQGNKDLMESALGKMNYCFESWHVNQFDVWQEVKNAPMGVYEIQVQGYVRCENSGYTRGDEIQEQIPIYLYLNKAMTSFPSVYSEQRDGWEYTTVEGWTTEEINGYLYPNSMGGASQCFAHDMYKKSAYGLVAKKGDVMRIGVKGDVPSGDAWWCIWDSFKLIYQGFQADVVLPALQEALTTIDISQPMGKEWFEKAAAAQAEAEAAIATGDGKEMFDALSNVYDLTEGIRNSVALFAKLTKANEELGAAIWQSDNDDAKAEASALNETVQNGIENHEFSDDDVEGLLDQIQKMMTKLAIPANYKDATDDAPADFTNVIVNPAYDEGVSGWSGTGAAWSDNGWNAEIFGKDYDYYQDIAGLPEGTYQVGVQAFYRAGGATADYEAYVANPDSLNHAFIYAMNGDSIVSSVPMKRLAAEANVGDSYDGYVQVKASSEEGAGDGLYVCNNMTAAGDEFAAEKYINEGPIVKVLADGKLRIGLKKTTNITDNWTLFDNWTLKYFGSASAKTPSDDPSGIKNAENAPVVRVEFFTLDGRKANTVAKGIMIVKETLANGNVIVKKIQK